MDYLIEGGNKLDGELSVYGSKNCALALLGATVLTDEEVVLTNCPNIVDVENLLQLLKIIGKSVWRVGDVVSVKGAIATTDVTDKVAGKLRGSVLLLGSILARYGQINLAMPGGCNIGSRPIDIHIDGLCAMGVSCQMTPNGVSCQGFPCPTTYRLRFPSVGGTQNLVCASVFIKGKTILRNCAVEPEIVALEKLLVKMGAKISGIGSSTLVIEGVDSLHSATSKVIPDRIVTATYLSAVVCACGKLTLTNCHPQHLRCFTNLLCKRFPLKISGDTISIVVETAPQSYGNVTTSPYPKFPTDMQSLLLSMSCYAKGKTTIAENLFENRLQHNANQLKNMGAKVFVKDNVATVYGSRLRGFDVVAGDLRGGAGLIIAGLGAQGVTRVGNIEQVNRGYLDFADNLNSVGAKIKVF